MVSKKYFIIFIMIFVLGFLPACQSGSGNEQPAFLLDVNGNYTGFLNFPVAYTVEDAEKDGLFITRGIEVIAGDKILGNFIKTAERNKDTGIRIANFYTEDTKSPYFRDLFFNDGYYYMFDSSSDNQEGQPFDYLLTLEGLYGNPVKDRKIIVLTNDSTLTFDILMKAMTSSNSEVIQSIMPYKLIIFQ